MRDGKRDLLKKKDHLIGYCRDKANKISPIWSTKKTYWDVTLKETCEGALIPLDVIKTANKWDLTKDKKHLPKHLKTHFNNGDIFITSETEKSPYWAFMIYPTNNRQMARVGVLCEKKNKQINPITVSIDNKDYLIEIKGCGSPIGGFPGAHFRLQAGAVSGFHCRVTGGLTLDGCKQEFDNLERTRTVREAYNYPFEVRALGMTSFTVGKDKFEDQFGSLCRLVPSTIRLSFIKNPAFTKRQPFDEKLAFNQAGQEVARFSAGEMPHIHRNISWNNLVYVAPKQYVLTDYEEAEPAYKGHCNLELPEFIYPLYFSATRYRKFTSDFFDGCKQVTGPLQALLNKNPNPSISQFNKDVIKKLMSLSIFRHRCEGHGYPMGLYDHVHKMTTFLPSSYFKEPLLPWVRDKLQVWLHIKKKLLTYYTACHDAHGIEILRACWNETCKNSPLQKEFNTKLKKIEPHARYLVLHNQLYQNKDIGKYHEESHLLTLYLVPETKAQIKEGLTAIKNVLKEIESYLETKAIQTPDNLITDILIKHRQHKFEQLINYIYPFISFLSVFYHNEQTILDGVLSNPSISDKERKIALSSKDFVEKQSRFMTTHPHKVYKKLCENKTAWIKSKVPPYYKKKSPN